MFLGLSVAAAIWIKAKHPESEAAKIIDKWIAKGCSVVQKPDALAEQSVTSTVKNKSDKLSVPVAEITETQPSLQNVSRVPEDSVLKRHYFAKLDAERMAITHPYPTDSVLRRHYESALVTITPAPVVDINPHQDQPKLQMPEDAVLRRHFLAQLRSEVASSFSARPTDSVLVRHYESHIQAEIKKRVA